MAEGRTRRSYPCHWTPPLTWYWGQAEDYENDNPVCNSGVLWIELAMDFGMATCTVLTGRKDTRRGAPLSNEVADGKAEDTVSDRGYNFAAAFRGLSKFCNDELLPIGKIVSTLVAHGGRPIAGVKRRFKLLNPSVVFKEVATQAITQRSKFVAGALTAKQLVTEIHRNTSPGMARPPLTRPGQRRPKAEAKGKVKSKRQQKRREAWFVCRKGARIFGIKFESAPLGYGWTT